MTIEQLRQKENFIGVMEEFRHSCDVNNKEIEKTKDIFEIDWICNITCRQHKLVISLIEQLFDFKDDWIDWFCFENNFGRKGYACQKIDGTEVFIKNAENLWDFVKDV